MAKNIVPAAGVRPRSPRQASAPKRDVKLPKSIKKTDLALAKLGRAGVADWDRRKQLLAHRTELSRRSDNEATRLRGTVEVSVDDPEATRKARRNLTRCRQSEAWRHNRLTGMQRDAEKEMEFAWRQRTSGLGAAVSKYGAVAGGSVRADLGADVDATWRDWSREATQRRIMVAAVIDVLSEPKTLADVERDHRMRRGQAMEHYVRGLDLWCELRGWIRGPVLQDGPTLVAEGVTR